jgi:hypothetical protein
VTALRTLAASGALDHGDAAPFYEQARHARQVNPRWLTVYLVKASGRQVMTRLRPLGTPVANVPNGIGAVRADLHCDTATRRCVLERA